MPLTALALDLIGPKPTGEDCDEYVFPGFGNNDYVGTGSVDHAIARIEWGIPKFTPHDLRRTLGTGLGEMGVPRLVVDKILDHADGPTTGIYDRHSYDAEKREALEAWAGRLEKILADIE